MIPGQLRCLSPLNEWQIRLEIRINAVRTFEAMFRLFKNSLEHVRAEAKTNNINAGLAQLVEQRSCKP